MRLYQIFFILFLPTAFLSVANAQSDSYGNFLPNQDYYLGLQMGHSVHVEDSLEEFNLSALVARLGYNYNQNLGLELRYGKSIDSDDFGPISLELDTLMGVYAVYAYNINKKINIYGVLGVTDVEINQEVNGFKNSYSETSPSLGAGIEFIVNKRARWTLEGMAYADADEFNYGTITGGFRISF